MDTNAVRFVGNRLDNHALNQNPTTERMEHLERRVLLLEQLAANSPVRDVASLLGAKGCVCPAGAEATCKGRMCSRQTGNVRISG
jgi:hypothetical protein